MGLAPILVVDGDPKTRDALVASLSRSGTAAQAVSDGAQALAAIGKTVYGLVITEMRLPDISGLELLRESQRTTAKPPVVILSGDGTVERAVEAMQAGAADYLLKPVSLEVLEKTAQAILANSNARGTATLAGKKGQGPPAERIVTRDPEFQRTLELAKTIAPSSATVLIQGETGTGKELLARYIHSQSSHPEEPYVAVNCAALPETLAESELFGHEKGAFTGAVGRKTGKFELARKGTIVLDEIGEMPLPLQAKLLRVLQERQIDRIGGTSAVPLRARVVTITNVDLAEAVAAAAFREDLYYRVNVVPLKVPPLRERRADIPLLAQYFLEKFSRVNNRSVHRIGEDALAALMRNPWKGNVRELENTIERAVLIGSGEVLEAEHLLVEGPRSAMTESGPSGVTAGTTVREMERQLIETTLEEVDQNRTRAAEMLGISIRTLRNKLREYKAERLPPANFCGS